ncbi:hypothetical protein ABPG75_004833 [Micractinium tetrahymenae]
MEADLHCRGRASPAPHQSAPLPPPCRPAHLAAWGQRRQAFYSTTRSSCKNGSRAAASRIWAVSRLVVASASSGGSDSNGSAADPPPNPQQAAAVNRLLVLSRSLCSRPLTSEEQQRQHILLLVQLGFAEAAIAQHIEGRRGGPHVAWQSVTDTVAVLRREGFSQQQLDAFLVRRKTRGGTVFTRQPSDVQANLRWLQQTFHLDAAGVPPACSKSPELLVYKQLTLAGNWRQIEAELHLAEAVKHKLAYALRRGDAHFLYYDPQTVMDKVSKLRGLLGLSDEQVSAKFGALACLFSLDAGKLKPRFELLQRLTGRPASSLAAQVLNAPALLRYPEQTLQRNYNAIVEAVGSEATAKLLLSKRPQILIAAVDRVARNLQTLQQLGCSVEAAVAVLLGNARLGVLDLEQPAFKARIDYWQAAYGLDSAEQAMLHSAEMLHRSLRTVAPRAEFWHSKHPGQPLPAGCTLARADDSFCRKLGLLPKEFYAFRKAWLEGEGAEVCRHERQPRKQQQQQQQAAA